MGRGVCVERGVHVGAGVSVGSGVQVGGDVRLGAGVRVAYAVGDACVVPTAIGAAGPKDSRPLLIAHQTPTRATHTMTNSPAPRPMITPARCLGDFSGWGVSSRSSCCVTSGALASAGGRVGCSSDVAAGSAPGAGEEAVLDGCASLLASNRSHPRLAASLSGLIANTFFRQIRRSSSVSTAPLSHSQAISLRSSCSTTCVSNPRASALRPSLRAAIPCFKSSSVASVVITYSLYQSIPRTLSIAQACMEVNTTTHVSTRSQSSVTTLTMLTLTES